MIEVLKIDEKHAKTQSGATVTLQQLNDVFINRPFSGSIWTHPFVLARQRRDIIASQAWEASMLTEAEHLLFAHLHAHGIDVEEALQLIHARVFLAQPVPWETIDDWQPQARGRFEHCGWIGRLGDLTPHVILEDLEADLTASQEAGVYVAAAFDLVGHAVVPLGSLPRCLLIGSNGIGNY